MSSLKCLGKITQPPQLSGAAPERALLINCPVHMFLEDVPSGIRVLIFYEAGKQEYVHNLTVPLNGEEELNLQQIYIISICEPTVCQESY